MHWEWLHCQKLAELHIIDNQPLTSPLSGRLTVISIFPANLPQLQPRRGESDHGEGGQHHLLPPGEARHPGGQRPVRLPRIGGLRGQRDGPRDQK